MRRAGTVRDTFTGHIAGFGSASGTRIVLGMWDRSPFGPVTDAMVERADGHRVLIAPTRELADYIAATYAFDEARVEQVDLTTDGPRRTVRSASLEASVTSGTRTAVGRLLRLVPGRLAVSRPWLRAIDPVAARIRDGVRTVGTAGGGRREYYGARDEHLLAAAAGAFDGTDLGAIAPVVPPVRFGFGSTPSVPSIVAVTTTIVRAVQAHSS